MSPRFPHRLGVVLLALCASACVVDRTGRSATHLYKEQLDNNRSRVQLLERDLAQEIARVSEMEEKAEAGRQRLADSGATLETFLEDLQGLRGQIADLQVDLRNNTGSMDVVDFRLGALEARLAFMEKKLNITPPLFLPPPRDAEGPPADGAAVKVPSPAVAEDPSPGATLAAADEEVVVESSAPSAEDLLFQQVLVFMKKKEYEKAGSRLQKFTQLYPDGARAIEAQYLTAQCLFELGRFKQAITSFQKVIEKNDRGEFAPKAMFMQGLSFEELGTPDDLEAARVFFGEIVLLYPDAPDADRARRKLEGLGGG